MLAIVVPTIAATLGVRLVVPRLQHQGALPAGLGIFRPARADRLGHPPADDHASGRRGLDRLARPRSGEAAAVEGCAARRPGRVARLEMAVHLPRPACREREPAGDPGRRAGALLPDLGERDERVLRAAARQHDLHDERHGDAAEPARRQPRHLPRPVEPLQRRRLLRHAFRRARRCRRTDFSAWVEATRKQRSDADRAELHRARPAEHAASRPSPTATSIPTCSRRSSRRRCRLARGREEPSPGASKRAEK